MLYCGHTGRPSGMNSEVAEAGALRVNSMETYSPHDSPNDPAIFAAEVRDLAIEAQHALNSYPVSASRLREALRRISRLQNENPGMTSEDLAGWLANLRRELESHLASRRPARVRS